MMHGGGSTKNMETQKRERVCVGEKRKKFVYGVL